MCTRFAAISQASLEEAVEAVRRAPGPGGCVELARKLGAVAVESDGPTAGHDQQDHRGADVRSLSPATVQEVFPGMDSAVILVRDGRLAVERMTFGFEAPWLERPGRGGKLIANARLEDALARPGSMWAESLAARRCVVPAWGFYEPHRSRTTKSPRTGRPVKQQVFFSLADGADGADDPEIAGAINREIDDVPGGASATGGAPIASLALFFAGIYRDGRFVIMTCAPNDSVASVHDRMPVVLRPEEVRIWLGPHYATLVDRSAVALTSSDAR